MQAVRLAAALGVFLGSFSCAAVPPVPLRLAMPFWPASDLAYLARDLGYYDPGRVELVETHWPLEVARAYRHGAVDVAPLPLEEALYLGAADPGQRIVLAVDFSLGGDAVVARAGITSPAALRGRTVAVEPSPLGAHMLAAFLARSGLTRKDVTVLLIDFEEHLEAMRSGRTDAVITFEPARGELLREGGHELFSSRETPGQIADVLVSHDETLNERFDDVVYLLEGWLRAVAYFRAQPLDAARRMSRRAGVGGAYRSPEEVLQALEGIDLLGLEENLRLLPDASSPLWTAARRVGALLLEQGVPARDRAPERLADVRPLLQVRP
jgi:NitT/TauT family transport system substrate-binding protein